jgi:hypothetical protein
MKHRKSVFEFNYLAFSFYSNISVFLALSEVYVRMNYIYICIYVYLYIFVYIYIFKVFRALKPVVEWKNEKIPYVHVYFI